jgi:hypothetical protein
LMKLTATLRHKLTPLLPAQSDFGFPLYVTPFPRAPLSVLARTPCRDVSLSGWAAKYNTNAQGG